MHDPRRGRDARSALGALALLALACATLPVPERPTPSGSFSHEAWDALLAAHVDAQGRLDYGALLADRRQLDETIAAVAARSPDSHPDVFAGRADRLAYWINAYNAWAVHALLQHYPVTSVLDVGSSGLARLLPDGAGFFLLQRIELGGAKSSLYALENRIVRPRFGDPRVHFALNCASASCPTLPPQAFLPDGLDRQLERETRRFVAQERNVQINRRRRRIALSAIFDWYESDFTEWLEREHPELPATLVSYVRLFLDDAARASLDACGDCEVEFLEYDWTLNDRH